MRRNRKTYNIFQLASTIFMILALVWLTISIPFVYKSQQVLSSQNGMTNWNTPLSENNEEEAANPFSDTTEEKSPNSGSSFSEEYLHDHHEHGHFISRSLPYHKCENAGVYTAFHGEVHVPPPNLA